MATITFDVAAFRALFPAFTDPPYSDASLQMYWDMATAYVTDKTGGCYIAHMSVKQQTLALNLMTAHLATLMTMAASGQAGGVVTGATVDKVSVQLQPPPSPNSWRFWLNQTPYGQQLLALLEVAAVGGWYYGGYPAAFTLRR